ncbi:uncharacterized protein LOC108735353 [Agrilus planipennis]|nr:uncharacterized protein LOC108735353 [Agrilus planipennis]XP_018322796.1 uncharacterized protein LOC108735353 [Agrilus planipennis]
MRSVIDVLRECAENVKTIFRTSSSDYSLRSSFKRQPEIRFATYTSEKLADIPDKYIGSNNTTCLEQLPKEEDSKSETLPHSSNCHPFCPLMKPLQCLLGLARHKSESVITVRNKQQAILDNIAASFKSNARAGLLQLKDLQDTSKHITFAAEIHETFPIPDTDNSPDTSEGKSCGSSKKEEEADANVNATAKQDTEGSQFLSSLDVLSTVNEQSNEENSSKSTNKQNRTPSTNDSKKCEDDSIEESSGKNKSNFSKKSDRSSSGFVKSQPKSTTSQQQSSKSAKSFKQQKQSGLPENEKKSCNSSTTVRKKSEINAYDIPKSEKSFCSKKQEYIVNYFTNVKPKSEIPLEDKDQKSEKSASNKGHRSEKSVSSATQKSKTLHSDISIKEETNYNSQVQSHRTSIACFQKYEKEPDNSTTSSNNVKTTSIVDEILQKEMNIIKKELEVLARKFNWKSGKPLTEDKQKSENSLSTNAPLDSLKSISNCPRNSELSLTDSEQKTEKNIEQLTERSFTRDERESEPVTAAKEQLQVNENCLNLIKDCSPKHVISTKCNSSPTTTTLKVEMTDTEGKLHQINATFESSDELQGIIEIDDNSVVHVKLLCGNVFQQSAIGIEKISDDIVQNYEIKPYGETSNESCIESGKETFQECNISGVKVCKKKGAIAAKAFSVTSVVTEIPMVRSTSSLGMCAEMTDKLKAIVTEMDKKLETPEGKKEVLDSLRSLCRLPSYEDASRANSCSEC